MYYRPRYLLPAMFVALLSLLSLMSCVSVNDKGQMISSANASTINATSSNATSGIRDAIALQSCDMPAVHQRAPTVAGSQTVADSLNPEKISLLNWNIYKGNEEGWYRDLETFAQNHDLMTIQEATLDEELTGLLEQHEFNWVMNTAFYLNGTAAGVMTVAKTETVHSCGFKTKEPIIRIPKSALISYYAIEGSDEKLLVANIHGINFTLGLDTYREQLDKLYQAVENHKGPVIVAGDFNTWSDDRMAEVDKVVNKLSLSRLEYPVNNKTHMFGNAIDHVFYRQLELLDKKVWQVSSSDHNPISVSFRYQ